MAVTRRSLLQAGSLLPMGASAATLPAADLAPAPLPEVPSLSDLASDQLTHHLHDFFNPPGLQNEWGHAQAAKSISGITAITFPPYVCCGQPPVPFSPGFIPTCEIALDGRLSAAAPLPGGQVTYQWFPHCVIRQTVIAGIRITTRAFLPSRRMAVAQEITLENLSGARRGLTLEFILRAFVGRQPRTGPAPGDADEPATPLPAKGCVMFGSRDGRTFSVQGLFPICQKILQRRAPFYSLEMAPGARLVFHYVNVIGDDAQRVLAAYQDLQGNFDRIWRENQAACEHRVRSAFTPGNSVYSGSLPRLSTRSRSLWKLYYTGFASLFYARVDAPASAIGPAYVSVRPRMLPTFVFLWDAGMISLSLALLDPSFLRKYIETWMVEDLDQHLAIDYLTGKAVGRWYGVNDMALLRSADDYLRISGDMAWLDQRLQGRTVLEHLTAHALRWKQLDSRGAGLADYGPLHGLLEVVSTYSHEVAAMNAGNVYGMRFVAQLLERKGNAAEARRLREEATALARRIVALLYVEGRGYWRCGQPDGSYNEVRHAYDFLTVLDTMRQDLSPQITSEMCDFFWRELYSPTWMHALSPGDVDSTWNYRADHSWLGAFAAWPPLTAKALLGAEKPANLNRVAAWIRGLAKSANQGPFGQAHIVESVMPPENGGALKCPSEKPYGNDWCAVAGGSFIDLILEHVFGLTPGLDGALEAHSQLALFDPDAALTGFRYHDALYRVDRHGARREEKVSTS